MDEKTILADLKERFGGRVYLTIADLAELYGTTPMALYHKRHRGRWPYGEFVGTDGSGQILVSIYKVAEVLAMELELKLKKSARAKPAAAAIIPTSKKLLSPREAARAIALARAAADELSSQAEAMHQLAEALDMRFKAEG